MQMARAFGNMEVSQLLLFAGIRGVWTTKSDHRSLRFLGTNIEYRENIPGDEWEAMNKYTVKNESFNKECFFTEKYVMRISGSSAEKGAHFTRLYSVRSQSFSSHSSFVNFNETQHYFAGCRPRFM